MLKPLHSLLVVIITLVIDTLLLVLFYMYSESQLTWSYYELPNNYEIYKKNIKSIYITKEEKKVINDYVLEAQYDKRYIMVKCINNKDLKGVSKKEINNYIDYKESKLDKITYQYYLIDSETDEVKGPLLKDEYDTVIDDSNILDEGTLVYWFRMY